MPALLVQGHPGLLMLLAIGAASVVFGLAQRAQRRAADRDDRDRLDARKRALSALTARSARGLRPITSRG